MSPPMSNRITRLTIAGALLFAGAARAEPPAHAKPPARAAHAASVDVEVLVVAATKEAGAFDPALDGLPALRKAPFDQFKSMKLLSKKSVKLADATPVTVDLPNGRLLQITLLERMADGRHKVQVSINRPKEKDYLPLLQVIASDEPFFVVGQKYEGNTLVIGVRVGAKPK